MRKITILLSLLSVSITAFSQISLTHEKNMPLTGDITEFKGFQYQDPGGSGAGIGWDFSGIQLTNEDNIVTAPSVPQQNLNGPAAYNLLLDDHGYEYYLQSSQDKLVEVALTTNKMSMVYSDPLIRMKFPFSYGDQYNDIFNGVAMFPGKPEYLISGDMTVTADGFGNLVLPNLSLQNVLRIKQVKNINELRPCSSCQTKTESYKWYAPGYRYPVLSMSTVTYQIDSNTPVTTHSAYVNLAQNSPAPAPANPGIVMNTDNDDFAGYTVTVYPNPFTEKLQYVYFLKEQSNVSLLISDVYGNSGRALLEVNDQKEGMHAGELDLSTYTLAPGVYFIRFIFGNKVITRKVVKI